MTDGLIPRLNAALEGRYTLDRKLGEGGMATVYLAKDLKHNRNVALKVLKPELAAVVGADRFLAEIETTANLQHPHILPLFDSGEADGFLFYVMPYVEGETLRERIDREHQLPVDEAVRIATAVSNALQHAHDRGVIHRDIKPANILMQDNEPLVADFGIALAVGAAGGSRLTETGLSVGTPFYMSPEQATGDQSIGPSSDLYAVAAVLYEMLTGEPPYTGTTAQAVLGRILQGQPVSATAMRQSVPPNVDAAIRKALEKLPADRFTGVQAFAKALGDPSFRHGGEAAAATAAAGAGPWKQISYGLGVALLALLGWMALAPDPSPGVTRQRVVLWDDLPVPLGGEIFAGHFMAIAPDGSSVVYLDQGPSGVQLFSKARSEADGSPMAGTEGGSTPAFSPDGGWVAFLTVTGELKKVRAGGGGAIELADNASSAFAAPFWGEDGFVYYVDGGFAIRRVPEDGGDNEIVVEVGGRYGLLASSIFVLPGSEAVLFTGCQGNCNQADVFVYDMTNDSASILFEDAYGAWYLPTGHIAYAALQGGIYVAPFDLRTLTVTSGAVPVLDGVTPMGLAISPTGTVIYAVGGAGIANELVWVTRQGLVVPVDPDWQGSFNYPAISPDGRRLAVSLAEGGQEQIWVKQLDRGPEEKLTSEGATAFRPEWTPDGRHITYVVGQDDLSRDLYRRRADGSADAEVQMDLPELGVWEANYSRDGQWMLYRTSDEQATGNLYAVSLADGDTVALLESEYDERQPVLSPDGRWFAYISNRSGQYEVYVRPFPNAGESRSVITSDGGSSPLWSPDGRELFYREGGMMRSVEVLAGETFRTGQVTDLFDAGDYVQAANRRQYDIHPDGERFLMLRTIGGGRTDIVYVENWFEELRARLGEGG